MSATKPSDFPYYELVDVPASLVHPSPDSGILGWYDTLNDVVEAARDLLREGDRYLGVVYVDEDGMAEPVDDALWGLDS